MFTWQGVLYIIYAVRVGGGGRWPMGVEPHGAARAHTICLPPAGPRPHLLTSRRAVVQRCCASCCDPPGACASLWAPNPPCPVAAAPQRPMANLIRAALTTGWWALMMTGFSSQMDGTLKTWYNNVLKARGLGSCRPGRSSPAASQTKSRLHGAPAHAEDALLSPRPLPQVLGCLTLFMTANLLKVLFAKMMARKFNQHSHYAKMHQALKRVGPRRRGPLGQPGLLATGHAVLQFDIAHLLRKRCHRQGRGLLHLGSAVPYRVPSCSATAPPTHPPHPTHSHTHTGPTPLLHLPLGPPRAGVPAAHAAAAAAKLRRARGPGGGGAGGRRGRGGRGRHGARALGWGLRKGACCAWRGQWRGSGLSYWARPAAAGNGRKWSRSSCGEEHAQVAHQASESRQAPCPLAAAKRQLQPSVRARLCLSAGRPSRPSLTPGPFVCSSRRAAAQDGQADVAAAAVPQERPVWRAPEHSAAGGHAPGQPLP